MSFPVLIVLHKTDESFGYYDVGTGQQLATIQTLPFPHEICLSPDRKQIYIAEMGVRGVESEGPGGHTVSIYDVKTHALINRIDTGSFDRPHGVATHSNGRLFVTSESTKVLLIYKLGTHELLHEVFLDQDCAHMVSVAPDGRTACTANIFSNSITTVDTDRGEVLRHIAVLERPEGMAFSPDGHLVYVVNRESRAVVVVDHAEGCVIDRIDTGDGPVRVAITPDGKRLAVPLFHAGAVQIIDTTQRKVTHTVEVGPHPAGTAMSSDGKLVFMSCEDENAVYVFSMDTVEIINKIPTGPGCDAMICLDAVETR